MDRYRCSFQHHEPITEIHVTPRGFSPPTAITVSASDGVVKFWRMQKHAHFALSIAESEDMRYPLEQVRRFKCGALKCRGALSMDGRWFAACSAVDGLLRIFDVALVDVVNIFTLPNAKEDALKQLLWIHREAQINRLLVSFQRSTFAYSGSSGEYKAVVVAAAPSDVGLFALANKSIFAFAKDQLSIIDADTFESVRSVAFKDPFEASSASLSPDASVLAVACNSDRQIRIFDAHSGRLKMRIDESLEMYQNAFAKGRFYPKFLGRAEPSQADFDRRMTLEGAIDFHFEPLFCDGDCLAIPSPIGIKVISLRDGRIQRVLGGGESQLRFTEASLIEAEASIGSLDSLALEVKSGAAEDAVDAMWLCVAHSRNRFYAFYEQAATEAAGKKKKGSRDFTLGADLEEERELALQRKRPKPAPAPSNTPYPLKFVTSEDADSTITAILWTNFGEIRCELFASAAPLAVDNFCQLAERGYYNNCTFHRIIRAFMLQTGDPTGTGCGGESAWGRGFPNDPQSSHTHEPLCLSMANTGKPCTNGSQFFITTVRCDWLDGRHTVFGRVVKGADVVHKIEHLPVAADDRPTCSPPPRITSIGIRRRKQSASE